MNLDRRWIAGALAAAWLCLAPSCWAAAEWRTRQTFSIAQPALDVAVSLDGQWVYVLTEVGQVLVCTREGIVKDRLEVGAGAKAIETGPEEGILYLIGGAAGEVRVLEVTLQHSFNYERSPSKGPSDAPVVIAAFSDFQ
jgi:hypothetical protein